MVQELGLVPGITLDKVLCLILFLVHKKYHDYIVTYSNNKIALKFIRIWKIYIFTCMAVFLFFAKSMRSPTPESLYDYNKQKTDVT
jgi:hypothetical protein